MSERDDNDTEISRELDRNRPTVYTPRSPVEDLISSLMLGFAQKPTAAPIRKLFGYQNDWDARAALRNALKQMQMSGYRIIKDSRDTYPGAETTTVEILGRFTQL